MLSRALALGSRVARGGSTQMVRRAPAARERWIAASAGDPNRELRVRHILVKDDQQKVDAILKDLNAGTPFAAMASQHSACPSSAKGGDLGWVKKGAMVPEFEDCAFAADVGVPTTCSSQFGHHVVLVEEERAAPPEIQTVGPVELAELLETKAEELQLIDVREERELEVVALPGFKHYPLSEFQTWGETVSEDLDPSKKTLCLCHHGMRSAQMGQFLLSQGFTDVVNIAGGIDAYARLVDQSLTRY